MRDIGKNTKRLRLRQRMTQDELAERLFVTRQTVSNYETGKSKPDVEMLVKISEVLSTDVQQLIYGLEANPNARKKRALVFGVLLILFEQIGKAIKNEITKIDRPVININIGCLIFSYIDFCSIATLNRFCSNSNF